MWQELTHVATSGSAGAVDIVVDMVVCSVGMVFKLGANAAVGALVG